MTHQYFRIVVEEVWKAATRDAVRYSAEVERIITKESAASDCQEQ